VSELVTVLHLATGHVLAAVSSGSLEPTVEQLTAGEHLVVRYDPAVRVEVPAELLTAARVAAEGDVLDRPAAYVVSDATPPLALGLKPEIQPTSAVTGPPGTDCLVVWQTPDGSTRQNAPLDASGEPPKKNSGPADATARLVAWKGGPLVLEDVP
jgi:hypothetical protein